MAKRPDIRNDLLRPNHLPAVAVPDLQITGWAGRGVCGGHHPDPLRWGGGGGGGAAQKFFSAFRASVWSKYIGGGAFPGSVTVSWCIQSNFPRADALEKQMNCLQL